MAYKDFSQRKEYSSKYKRKIKQIRSESNFKYENKEFICFDGETLNDSYVLLGNSENHIYNEKGLSTYQCINFLYYEGYRKIKIIFAIHFDIQHWIKDLSDDKIIRLLNNEEITFYGYKLRYITKKFLIITKKGKRVYIYDISSFFQSSLLKTIEQMNLSLTNHEKEYLEKGKSLRGENFKSMDVLEIIEYNKIECIVTERIADKLKDILLNAKMNSNSISFNLFPARFYGAGAVAKKVLKILNFGVISNNEKNLSEKIKKFIYSSYYGGRAEIFKIGSFKNVYKYDINSAYPFVLSKLKKIKNYKIKKINKEFSNYNFIDENIYYIETDFRNCDNELIGVLPFRRKDGYIIYPQRVRGNYFGIECKYLNDLVKKCKFGSFKIYSVLEINYSEELLFEEGFIENIYKKRLELKEKNDASQIAYKLILNSLYGKLAQQTGSAEFAVILYASFITAVTRSMILEQLFNNDCFGDLIQISTDGIFLTKKLNCKISKNLGEWSEDYYKKGIVLGSGVYGLYGDKNIFALRGLIVSKENLENIYLKLKKNKTATIEYKNFIGHKLALAQADAYGKYRLKFATVKKTLKPFEYEKRIFLKQNSVDKISHGLWFDEFENKKITDSGLLKKFDLDLIEESMSIGYK